MATKNEKPAVPVPPVGADGGQPLSKNSEQSIAEEISKNNPQEKNYEEMIHTICSQTTPSAVVVTEIKGDRIVPAGELSEVFAKYTDAQKNASIKYLDEKTDSIQIRTPKGTKERWREAATAAGTSLNRYIMDAVEEKIEKHPK